MNTSTEISNCDLYYYYLGIDHDTDERIEIKVYNEEIPKWPNKYSGGFYFKDIKVYILLSKKPNIFYRILFSISNQCKWHNFK